MLNPDRHEWQSSRESDAHSFELRDLMTTIRQSRRFLLLAVIAGMAGGYFLSMLFPTRYVAEAVLLADPPQTRVSDLRPDGTSIASDPLVIRTIVGTIGSTLIVERAIQNLAPDTRAALLPAKSAASSYVSEALERLTSYVGASPKKDDESRAERRVTNYVERRLNVDNDAKSYIIQVRYTASNPDVSAAVANSVAHAYLDYRSEQKRQTYQQTSTNLGGKLASLQAELKEAERKAQALREEVRIQDLRSEALTGSKQEQVIAEKAEAYAKVRGAEREAQAIAAVYEQFLLRQREAEGRQDLPETDVRLLSPARAPLDPSGPGKGLLMALGTVAGLLAGISFATLRSRFRREQEL